MANKKITKKKAVSNPNLATINVRLPKDLKALVVRQAQASKRSINQQIVYTLERAAEVTI